MKAISKFLGAATAAYFSLTSMVMAAPCSPTDPNCVVPEPSSLALVGLGIAGVVWFAYKGKK